MYIKQISVFLENTTGRLANFTRVLADNDISMKALCIADSDEFGILRCLVDDPEEAKKILQENGYSASITEVIAVEMESKAGGLYKILKVLAAHDMSVDYVYSIVGTRSDERSVIIIKVEDPKKAVDVLTSEGLRLFCLDEIE